jgi:hypothetical protein
MTVTNSYPSDATSFQRILGSFERVLHTENRLPHWPFRSRTGTVDICQFSLAIEGPFGPVLQALVEAHEDTSVSLVVLDPAPAYYRTYYGSYPGFTLPAAGIAENYWDAVSFEPGGDPTGSVAYTANVVALVGSSGKWAVWAERSWDIALVQSQRAQGPWTSVGVNFVPVEDALANFTEPGYKLPLPSYQRATFLENFRKRESSR